MATQMRSRAGGDWWFARAPVAWSVLAVVLMTAMTAPWLTPYAPQAILDPVRLRSQSISWAHWLGTDPLSRDVLSRLLSGARISLTLACGAAVCAAVFGTVVGVACGYRGGWVDRVIMRAVDVLLAVPRVLLLLTIVGVWGAPSLVTLLVVLAATGWMGIARLVRNEVRALRMRDHVVAAHAIGQNAWGVMRRHLLPAVLPLVLVAATTAAGQLLLLESGLSFLGVGVQPPAASWGTVLLDVSDVIGPARWLVLGPGLVLVATVVAIHRVGDSLGLSRFDTARLDS